MRSWIWDMVKHSVTSLARMGTPREIAYLGPVSHRSGMPSGRMPSLFPCIRPPDRYFEMAFSASRG